MDDTLLVDRLNTEHHLLENDLGFLLWQLASLLEKVEKVTATAQFHHDIEMLLCLERLVYLGHVACFMPQISQHVDLPSQFKHASAILLNLLKINRFNRNELPCHLVQSDANGTIAARSNHFAQLVHIWERGWHFTIL